MAQCKGEGGLEGDWELPRVPENKQMTPDSHS